MPWFDGQPLLGQLEDVHIASDRNLVDNRFPVQYVIRPSRPRPRLPRLRRLGRRRHLQAGRRGDGPALAQDLDDRRDRHPDGAVDQAFPPMAVTMLLEDELDISRGDMICRPSNQPTANSRFEAMICWFDETSSLRTGAPYQLKHTTRWIAPRSRTLRYRLNVDTLHRDLNAETLEVNDIGRVAIHTTSPLFFDEYRMNRTTGSFILVDPATNLTVAAGMIIGAGSEPATGGDDSVVADEHHLPPEQPLPRGTPAGARNRGATIWMTGLSGSGKSTIAAAPSTPWSAAAAPPTCSTATTSATASTPTSASARRTGPRTCAGSARSRSCWPNRASSRSSPWSAPSGDARDKVRARPRGGRHPLLRGLRRHAAGGVRTARPEGPLREGAGRRDHRPDRSRQPLRGAGEPGADDGPGPGDGGPPGPRSAGLTEPAAAGAGRTDCAARRGRRCRRRRTWRRSCGSGRGSRRRPVGTRSSSSQSSSRWAVCSLLWVG